MKERSQRPEGERSSLTPSDQAFLASPPTYEDGESLLPSLPPPVVHPPSAARRVTSLLLFVAIAGGAMTVLGLAVMRLLGRAVLGL